MWTPKTPNKTLLSGSRYLNQLCSVIAPCIQGAGSKLRQLCKISRETLYTVKWLLFVDRTLHWWDLSEHRGTCEHPRVNVCGLLNTARHLDAIQTYYANLTVGSSYIHTNFIKFACHVLSSSITTNKWCENYTPDDNTGTVANSRAPTSLRIPFKS